MPITPEGDIIFMLLSMPDFLFGDRNYLYLPSISVNNLVEGWSLLCSKAVQKYERSMENYVSTLM